MIFLFNADLFTETIGPSPSVDDIRCIKLHMILMASDQTEHNNCLIFQRALFGFIQQYIQNRMADKAEQMGGVWAEQRWQIRDTEPDALLSGLIAEHNSVLPSKPQGARTRGNIKCVLTYIPQSSFVQHKDIVYKTTCGFRPSFYRRFSRRSYQYFRTFNIFVHNNDKSSNTDILKEIYSRKW